MWMLFSVASAGPNVLELTYKVDFDLDAMGDKLCGLTKFCDCSSVYAGRGTIVEAAPDRVTFRGTWTIGENSCQDPLKVWVPADGVAFHTLWVTDGKVTAWVVSDEVSNAKPRKQAIKENKQFWIDELAIPWPTKRFEATQQDAGDMGMGITLTATHHLLGAVTGADAK